MAWLAIFVTKSLTAKWWILPFACSHKATPSQALTISARSYQHTRAKIWLPLRDKRQQTADSTCKTCPAILQCPLNGKRRSLISCNLVIDIKIPKVDCNHQRASSSSPGNMATTMSTQHPHLTVHHVVHLSSRKLRSTILAPSLRTEVAHHWLDTHGHDT
jgi:hypothetical protein